ncbi:hypothetical protein NDA11_006167 [Ustilago hordei]|uniref:Uncharacterized protein n=1 Tax=Ustilago hordei TaxID=120017 RepID=I2FZ81_USTHO|nr:uncharacterized protein UHO2_03112 [Ustilago hordei]KAJ1576939.1 hypothetical protein NDA15_003694 [Ustilago hordei]KAJ1578564.1 hypothetical protein NDA12_002014 [Ustilago hordei]KAJ1584195.1 hypothetical protein NDA11_006167 [Ustilago hordei]CCF52224.1 uncharacterized protein UHOR_03502 [Ustilago hordei]SYW83884.1 uncharacterized protein UHO2_03112 [Ustilago hordei]
MAITLQTVLPQKVLPTAPSPDSASPNPGVRSTITQFIPASPDASLDADSATTPTGQSIANGSTLSNATSLNRTRAMSSSSQATIDESSTTDGLRSPGIGPLAGRKSMSAGAGSRRGIAHSSRVLGVDKNKEDTFALSQLTNGKVDVSFEGSLNGQPPLSPSRGKGKGRARDVEDGDKDAVALFDVDLESGQSSASGTNRSFRAGRLLQLGAQSMPWKKSRATLAQPDLNNATESSSTGPTIASRIAPATDSRNDLLDFCRPHKGLDEENPDYSADAKLDEDDDYRGGLGALDDDREQLLYAGADGEERPGYFAPGDRSFAYNSLQGHAGMGGYGGAVGFEAVTWREGGWMMLSSALVAVLVMVAILISVDVIDWPGDGIGSN